MVKNRSVGAEFRNISFLLLICSLVWWNGQARVSADEYNEDAFCHVTRAKCQQAEPGFISWSCDQICAWADAFRPETSGCYGKVWGVDGGEGGFDCTSGSGCTSPECLWSRDCGCKGKNEGGY